MDQPPIPDLNDADLKEIQKFYNLSGQEITLLLALSVDFRVPFNHIIGAIVQDVLHSHPTDWIKTSITITKH